MTIQGRWTCDAVKWLEIFENLKFCQEKSLKFFLSQSFDGTIKNVKSSSNSFWDESEDGDYIDYW